MLLGRSRQVARPSSAVSVRRLGGTKFRATVRFTATLTVLLTLTSKNSRATLVRISDRTHLHSQTRSRLGWAHQRLNIRLCRLTSPSVIAAEEALLMRRHRMRTRGFGDAKPSSLRKGSTNSTVRSVRSCREWRRCRATEMT